MYFMNVGLLGLKERKREIDHEYKLFLKPVSYAYPPAPKVIQYRWHFEDLRFEILISVTEHSCLCDVMQFSLV
jgi:hypothetical protein